MVGWVALLASISVRARRWGTLLGASQGRGEFGLRHKATFIGFAGNCLLPANAGEVARAVIIHRLGGVPWGAAIGSILAERLLDAVAVFLLLLAPLIPGAAAPSGGVGLESLYLGWIGVALLLVGGGFLVAANWPGGIARLAGAAGQAIGLGRFKERIISGVSSLLSGLEALRFARRLLVALVETLCIWGLMAAVYGSGMLAFGITSPGISGGLFVSGMATMVVAIPSSPGYFGPFEAAIRLALGMYSIPAGTIVAYSLVLHLLMFISLTAIGLALAARLGLSWAELVTASALPSHVRE
jgi:hypothetical protein